MSFWRRFTGHQTAPEIKERTIEVKQVADSKEEHYRVMKRFAMEAGDEAAVRYYSERLDDLALLRYELEVVESEGGS